MLTVDGAGNLIIADIQNNRIRKMAPNGTISPVAGTEGLGYSCQIKYSAYPMLSIDFSMQCPWSFS